MLLSVDHVTTYRYDRPVRGVVQSHRLVPSAFDGQKLRDWSVTVSDGVQGGAFRDGAGDRVQGWTVRGPVSEITVRVAGTVETVDLAGVLRGHRESVPAEVYLCDTLATQADAALAALAEQARDEAGDLAQAHRLSALVSDAIAYVPGATHARTTAAEALAQGQGVCQDHTQALIACARHLGLPARYVSGYLFASGEGAPEAAHAWAEIFVGGLGWIGFDASNRCCPDDRYIRLGSGFDAVDAAPIRGTARGGGAESLDVAVAVRQVQQ
ncbi:transglutaminase family protein [Paragemmobacter straminiformis]|uniref:Transglutaminase family protein n=1 Tax=Paragemmobacter straminiformis TaxID=2045119 RepID=A0A842HYT4_9RHOB|nr:transglutaminase family protein [Gemmobacter straminiformis]MBC2833912.1 transglutaminase family protein [Gemmobacter straminiformis]